MKRVAGIGILLIGIMLISAIIEPAFVTPYNMKNILRWTGLFGLLSLGEAFVIMTGGIDLSVGAIISLLGAFSAHFLKVQGMPIPLALFLCIGFAVLMGMIHGILVTKVKMQPFVVTLCGLFIYRGLARFTMNDVTQGYHPGNFFEPVYLWALYPGSGTQ
jgi:ribose transport system permease protein